MKALYAVALSAGLMAAVSLNPGTAYPDSSISENNFVHKELTTLGLKKKIFIEKRSKAFFTDIAQRCIQGSELKIADIPPKDSLYGKKPNGTYDGDTRIRKVDFDIFGDGKDSEIIGINVHELLHDTEIHCSLVDRFSFMEAYRNLNSKKYPVKEKVEKVLEKYNPRSADMEGEAIAYTMAFWLFDSYEVPDEMQDMFSFVLEEGKRVTPKTIFVSSETETPPEKDLEDILRIEGLIK